jgi:hypothetical protein
MLSWIIFFITIVKSAKSQGALQPRSESPV